MHVPRNHPGHFQAQRANHSSLGALQVLARPNVAAFPRSVKVSGRRRIAPVAEEVLSLPRAEQCDYRIAPVVVDFTVG